MDYPEHTPESGELSVSDLKDEYGGKKNNWVPIDKAAAAYLPTDREYTRLEALFSYQKDLDEGKSGTLAGYARLWKWSRTKVRKFLSELETEEGHKKDRRRTLEIQPIHVINKNLWHTEKQKKNRRRTEEEQKKDTTIHPNPNPNPKETNVVGFTDLSPADLARKFFEAWREPKKRGEKFKEYANRLGGELDAFCNYWTERTRSGKKERWEIEKTWELPRRIGTWNKNNNKISGNGKYQEEPQREEIKYFK